MKTVSVLIVCSLLFLVSGCSITLPGKSFTYTDSDETSFTCSKGGTKLAIDPKVAGLFPTPGGSLQMAAASDNILSNKLMLEEDNKKREEYIKSYEGFLLIHKDRKEVSSYKFIKYCEDFLKSQLKSKSKYDEAAGQDKERINP